MLKKISYGSVGTLVSNMAQTKDKVAHGKVNVFILATLCWMLE